MTKLTKEDIKYIAKLARIDLSTEEIEVFQKQLVKIVDYINELNEIDTKGFLPTSQTTGLTNIFRKDEVRTHLGLTAEEALSGTEKVHNNYFVVDALFRKKNS